MKKQYSLIALCLALCAGSAFAAKEAAPKTAAASDAAAKPAKPKQQTKMGNCSKEAKTKSLKGDERKQFMSTCLKA